MIKIKNLTKIFQNPETDVLEGISLDIKKGEFVTFFGPNGCGKTTLFYIIAGLMEPTKGDVLINSNAPESSNTGFIFQNYSEALFPWRTVRQNIEFGLEIKGLKKGKRNEVSKELLKKTGLFEHRNKYTYQLSGGEQQKVAIARALANNPDVILLDEPFSSLDYSTVREMEMDLLSIWEKTGKTMLFVSHEVDEAVLLADKVVVLSGKPARIKGIIRVNLPRPRNLDMMLSGEFFKIKNDVLRMFRK